MTKQAIELLHYITEAIDADLNDFEINRRLEEVANSDLISNDEYCKIYEAVLTALKVKMEGFK